MILGCGHSQDSLKNYSLSLSVLLDSLSLPEEGIHVKIDKSDYVLSIVSDTIVIKQYPVVFGSNPVRDKLRQGDRRTPEGRFNVITKYPHKRWNKFIILPVKPVLFRRDIRAQILLKLNNDILRCMSLSTKNCLQNQ
jgi:hypothetical protein